MLTALLALLAVAVLVIAYELALIKVRWRDGHITTYAEIVDDIDADLD